MIDIQAKVNRFNSLQKKAKLEEKEEQELNDLAEEFLEITKQVYNQDAIYYDMLDQMSESDIANFDMLFQVAEKELNKSVKDMSILDCGTGPGRDIKYLYQKGIKKVVGLDNSKGFIEILKEREKTGEIPPNSFVEADMRELPFRDNTFDIVRQYASLVHMPMTTREKMLDKVMKENYRVLKEEGILFVAVKKGKGIQWLKTKKNVGARIFQFHTVESITQVLKKNNFLICKVVEIPVKKEKNITDWIIVIAKKG